MSFDAEYRGESKSGIKSKFYARHRKINPLLWWNFKNCWYCLLQIEICIFLSFRKLCSSGTEKIPRFYCIFETNALRRVFLTARMYTYLLPIASYIVTCQILKEIRPHTFILPERYIMLSLWFPVGCLTLVCSRASMPAVDFLLDSSRGALYGSNRQWTRRRPGGTYRRGMGTSSCFAWQICIGTHNF